MTPSRDECRSLHIELAAAHTPSRILPFLRRCSCHPCLTNLHIAHDDLLSPPLQLHDSFRLAIKKLRCSYRMILMMKWVAHDGVVTILLLRACRPVRLLFSQLCSSTSRSIIVSRHLRISVQPLTRALVASLGRLQSTRRIAASFLLCSPVMRVPILLILPLCVEY